jgi:hypothetical protein
MASEARGVEWRDGPLRVLRRCHERRVARGVSGSYSDHGHWWLDAWGIPDQGDRTLTRGRTGRTCAVIVVLIGCSTGGATNETARPPGVGRSGSDSVAGEAGSGTGGSADQTGHGTSGSAAIGGSDSASFAGGAQGGAASGAQGGAAGSTEMAGHAGSGDKWSCHVVSEAGKLCRCSTPFDLIGGATPLVDACPATPCCVTQSTASYSTCTCWDIPAGQCASTYTAPEWTLVASCPPPAGGGTVTVPTCTPATALPAAGTNCAVYPNLCGSNGDCVLPPHQYVCSDNAPPPVAGCVQAMSAKGEPYYCCSELRCVRYAAADATCKQLGTVQGYSCPPDTTGLPMGCSAVGNNLCCCP